MTLGIDIGGTKTLVAVFDDNDNIVFEEKHPTDKIYPNFLKFITKEIEHLKSLYKFKAIGIAAPGTMDYTNNVFTRFANLKWENVAMKRDIEDIVKLPIAIDNDANVGAVGEARTGAGKDFREVLYITISTGIGIGVTVNGKIDPALADSEVGHSHLYDKKGNSVEWEKIASGKAFFERYGMTGEDCDDSKIWEEFSQDILHGLDPLIATVGPDIVVVGGSMGEHLHKYYNFLFEGLQANKSKVVDIPKIVPAKYPDHAVIYGCNLIAKDLLPK